MRTDRRTERHDEANSLISQFYERALDGRPVDAEANVSRLQRSGLAAAQTSASHRCPM
jgi:hypothetical protein